MSMQNVLNEKPILQGVLWKRAQKSGNNWRRRYFKLFSKCLVYSEKENGRDKGRMDFDAEFFVQDYPRAKKGTFGFLVTNFEVSHYLAAETKDQKDFWCHAIALVIRKQLDQARYFEDVRKSVKIVDQDLAEKQYQARLDNYYKTVGRPEAKQNRKSVVDFRAAQMMAEAAEAESKLGHANDTEKEHLKKEAERLAREAHAFREQAEKDGPGDSVVVGPTSIPEEELGEHDEDDDDEPPAVPDLPVDEPVASGNPLSVETTLDDIEAMAREKTPAGSKTAPILPPRKNTIQPTSASAQEIIQAAATNTDLSQLTQAAAPSRSGSVMVPPSPSSNRSPNLPSPSSAAVASRSPSIITPASATNRSPSVIAQPTVQTTNHRPSVAALAQNFDKGTSDGPISPNSSAPPSRRPTLQATPSDASRRPTLQQSDGSATFSAPAVAIVAETTSVHEPETIVSPSRKVTVTSPPPAVVQAPAPVIVASQPPAAVTAAADKGDEKPKVSGGLASKLGMWQNRVETHQDKQANNVFSGAYQGKGKVEISKDQYGKAPEGSKTEERAKAAQDWVEQEIDKLIKVIVEMGTFDPEEGGVTTVKFGPLFYKYADISDTLVGILMRAKKRKRIMYQGDMLFQS